MVVNYNKIHKKFSQSRKNMKWEEISYFIHYIQNKQIPDRKILDVGCGSGRLLGELIDSGIINASNNYLGIDFSDGLLQEAKKTYPLYTFNQGDMRDQSIYGKNRFDIIFFVASFHHLENEQDRLDVLKKCSTILNDDGYIFMTNWALDSDLNKDKYTDSKIITSQNMHGNFDYSIKFGEHMRFYHGFSTDELQYLSEESGFQCIENRIFDSKKNFISIFKK